MKVRWLNADLTEAEVTVGFWWWRRVAIVALEDGTWIFRESRHLCSQEKVDGRQLHYRMNDERRAAQLASNWRRPAELPRAKLLKGG